MDNFFGPKTITGEMYIIPDDSYSINITQTGIYGSLSGFHKGKESYVVVDEVNGTFTIKVKGSYKFAGVASIFPSAGMFLEFAVFVNDVFQQCVNTSLDFKNSQDTNTFSGTGWMNLNIGDVVDVRGKSDTAPVTVNISHMNSSINRRGI